MKIHLLTDREEDERIVESYMRKLGPRQHACKECPGKMFQNKGNLRAHIENFHYSPGYFCLKCGKRFKAQKNCKSHIKLCQ